MRELLTITNAVEIFTRISLGISLFFIWGVKNTDESFRHKKTLYIATWLLIILYTFEIIIARNGFSEYDKYKRAFEANQISADLYLSALDKITRQTKVFATSLYTAYAFISVAILKACYKIFKQNIEVSKFETIE